MFAIWFSLHQIVVEYKYSLYPIYNGGKGGGVIGSQESVIASIFRVLQMRCTESLLEYRKKQHGECWSVAGQANDNSFVSINAP